MSARDYADGMRDGIVMTLTLALGEENPTGGNPFPDHESLPDTFLHWAERAREKAIEVPVSEAIAEALYRARS
jgi:hypothetical protein